MGPLRHAIRLAAFCLAALLCCPMVPAAYPSDAIPPQLAPWKDWVLYGHENELCPPLGNDVSRRICVFPQKLVLRLEAGGAAFELTVDAKAKTEVVLPYAQNAWPRLDAGPESVAAVADKGGAPTVRLSPGEHRLTGRLAWSAAPESLRLSPRTGLLELYRDGVLDPAPDLSPSGELRLSAQGAEAAKTPENAQDVTVFRLFTDSIPAVVTTAVRLDVSGMARRIELRGLLPEGSEPLAVRGPLPLAFGPEGTLIVQAGPGGYMIEVDSRLSGPVDRIGPMACPFGPEIWSFAARRDLREAEAGGLASVDPATTRMPGAWTGYPAYLAEKGAVMTFTVLRRGVETGKNDLSIDRELWLDFDGRGLSARDRVSGTMVEGWTLSMTPPGEPGRISVDGRDQPIALLGDPPAPGVEVRRSRLNVMAESRYPSFEGSFPAAGWNRDFGAASALLRLPPGWRLFMVSGADASTSSWTGRWNLLNIFLTLVISLAAFKLCGKGAGFALFAFLALSYHEADAPVVPWIVLLVCLALLMVTREGVKARRGSVLRRLVTGLYALAAAVLAVSSVVFLVTQLRYAIYPQLEPQPYEPRAAMSRANMAPSPVPAAPMRTMAKTAPGEAPAEDFAVMEAAPETADASASSSLAGTGAGGGVKQKRLEYDPYALVQTGPGMPDWSWRAARLSWNGPVTAGESVRLYLISPGMNLAVAIVRVLLLGLALWLTAAPRRLRGIGGELFPERTAAKAGGAGAAFALALTLAAPGVSQAADFPPKDMLDQLRARLLEPADCFPDCLAVSQAAIRLDEGSLTLELALNAAAPAAIPLPGVSGRWRPLSVSLDGQTALLAGDGEGGLLLYLPQGAHRAILAGPVPLGEAFDLSFPLAPKSVTADAPGWTVQGLSADGRPAGALRFARIAGKDLALPRETYRIEPFFETTRTFDLGLTWEVETVVARLTPADGPAVADIALLPGESVLSDAVPVKDGLVSAVFKPGQERVSWRSRLEITPRILLTAPRDVPFVERYVLAASPIWSVTVKGLPAVRLLDGAGDWRPQFRPWPGESLEIVATRPKAAPGPSMTIDRAVREIVQGERLREETLSLSYRASKGGRAAIVPPPGAEIQDVTSDGAVIPYGGSDAGEISYPVSPGAHAVTARWRLKEEAGTRLAAGPADLKMPAANVETRIRPPEDRWILFVHGDTPMGPAVLFWSYLAAVIAAAFGLGRLPFSPLKSWQWALLGIGLTQVDAGAAFVAVAWLLALGLRRKNVPEKGWFGFDLMQIVLVLLVLAGLSSLYEAIQTGLLGLPRMQIGGNGSSARELIWTMDRISGPLPEPGAFSVPLYVYRAVMLVWSLWLAWSLLGWLKWGYAAFGQGGVWRKPVFAPRKPRFRFRDQGAAPGQPSTDVKAPERADAPGETAREEETGKGS